MNLQSRRHQEWDRLRYNIFCRNLTVHTQRADEVPVKICVSTFREEMTHADLDSFRSVDPILQFLMTQKVIVDTYADKGNIWVLYSG